MRNIVVEFPSTQPIEKQHVELVERKGVGHPDSLCDGIAESVSRALSREYNKRYGRILHHNTDQVELVGGGANPIFGGGEMIKPVYILLSGRATTRVGEDRIPVAELAIKATRDYLTDTLRNIDVETFAEIDQRLGEGSADLTHVFDKTDRMPKSNDTSFGVGFAPFSITEKLVYDTERYINTKIDMREVGEDVKVMGFRNKEEITLTIAAAMVSKYIPDLDHYISTIEELRDKLKNFTADTTDKDIEIHINTGDDYENKSVYLTLTGTSAEQGDDGSVGRGNRANGLITPFRPVSLEATSGKNPVNHVGKLYNLLTGEIAKDIVEAGADEAYVRMMSQIGKPIDQPIICSISIIGDGSIESKAKEIADYRIENIKEITQLCLEGKISTF